MISRLLWIGFYLVLANVAQAADFRVTFVNPGNETGFWGQVSQTMRAAAEDLDVDLEILNANRQPYAMEELLQQRLMAGDLPDYFILVNENEAAARLVQLMAGKSSKVLFLLNKLTPKQKGILENRGIDLSSIIASIVPDNETAGYEMAQSLFARARVLDPDKKEIRLLALTGDAATPDSLHRELGMERAVADNPDVTLVREIPVDWNCDQAKARTRDVLGRTHVDVIWGVDDAVALGARNAVEELGLKPGKDVLFAGLNWSRDGMDAVRNGEMTMTHGGHFFAGAWSLVMLRDHFFKSAQGEVFVDVLFKMSPINSANIDQYRQLLGDEDWGKIDFRRFSKSDTGRSSYDFSAEAIMKASGS